MIKRLGMKINKIEIKSQIKKVDPKQKFLSKSLRVSKPNGVTWMYVLWMVSVYFAMWSKL